MWVMAVAGCVFLWQLSMPLREGNRWGGCIGRSLSVCQVPSGYDEPMPCPDWQECSTNPAGTRYLSAQLSGRSGGLWSSYAYAAIALDGDGRIVEVEVKRFYAMP